MADSNNFNVNSVLLQKVVEKTQFYERKGSKWTNCGLLARQSLIVPDFTISVYDSSCKSLIWSLLSLYIYWQPYNTVHTCIHYTAIKDWIMDMPIIDRGRKE